MKRLFAPLVFALALAAAGCGKGKIPIAKPNAEQIRAAKEADDRIQNEESRNPNRAKEGAGGNLDQGAAEEMNRPRN